MRHWNEYFYNETNEGLNFALADTILRKYIRKYDGVDRSVEFKGKQIK